MPDRSAAVEVKPGVSIPLEEIAWRFSTSSGPGGQHVNTSQTRAEAVLDVAASPSLPPAVRARLVAALGPVVAASAGDTRSQARNRELALERLAARLRRALEVAPPRRPTRRTLASQRRRLEQKRRQSLRKRERRAWRGPDPA